MNDWQISIDPIPQSCATLWPAPGYQRDSAPNDPAYVYKVGDPAKLCLTVTYRGEEVLTAKMTELVMKMVRDPRDPAGVRGPFDLLSEHLTAGSRALHGEWPTPNDCAACGAEYPPNTEHTCPKPEETR